MNLFSAPDKIEKRKYELIFSKIYRDDIFVALQDIAEADGAMRRVEKLRYIYAAYKDWIHDRWDGNNSVAGKL